MNMNQKLNIVNAPSKNGAKNTTKNLLLSKKINMTFKSYNFFININH